nr:hypothetical protein [Tanacetum cinerariifolium]
MLNKENYVSWSSRLLRYAKSRPNGKLICNSIINGPYVKQMIPEPGYPNREVLVNETFHMQTDDELSEKELKQIEDDDQAIQACRISTIQEGKVEIGKALDVSLVVIKSSETELEKHDTSSRSGNDADADNADIRPIYDEDSIAKVQLNTKCNIFATRQQHTEQPEIITKDKAMKKTQERDRNSKTIAMPSARFQSTADDSKPKPRSTNHSTRSLFVSKSSCVTKILQVRIVLKCTKITKKPDNIHTRLEATKKSQIKKQVFSK